jgi:hypothetical protein
MAEATREGRRPSCASRGYVVVLMSTVASDPVEAPGTIGGNATLTVPGLVGEHDVLGTDDHVVALSVMSAVRNGAGVSVNV